MSLTYRNSEFTGFETSHTDKALGRVRAATAELAADAAFITSAPEFKPAALRVISALSIAFALVLIAKHLVA